MGDPLMERRRRVYRGLISKDVGVIEAIDACHGSPGGGGEAMARMAAHGVSSPWRG